MVEIFDIIIENASVGENFIEEINKYMRTGYIIFGSRDRSNLYDGYCSTLRFSELDDLNAMLVYKNIITQINLLYNSNKYIKINTKKFEMDLVRDHLILCSNTYTLDKSGKFRV